VDIVVLPGKTVRMDRLTSLELFVRIVDRGSFTAAASDLGLSRPVATAAHKALERRLGTRLLQRSTRHVQPTVEGEAYYRRCVAILADVEDADRGVSGAVAGLLRVDVAGNLARTMLLPGLPAFLALHPALTVHFGEGERLVDLVREGVDCVVRAGTLADSDMVIRRLGAVEEITCASPGYLAEHGIPASPDRLGGHVMVGFVSSRTGQKRPLEFTVDGESIEVMLPARVLAGGADMSVAAARFGLGLIQAPRHRFKDDLASGALVEVLANFPPTPTPLSVLYPSNRQLSPRVRVFVDWLVDTLGPQLAPAQRP
jgi:DNA-binding transcriptional LysR family regulator